MIDINESKRIWDERLVRRYKELGYTQQSLAQALDELHPERGVNQTMVSRWCHLHDTGRSFPKYETMREIADLLDTTVAWLTGQIDGNDWDQERARMYLGLEAEGIQGLYNVTHIPENSDAFPISRKAEDLGLLDLAGESYGNQMVLSAMFESRQFGERFVPAMRKWANALTTAVLMHTAVREYPDMWPAELASSGTEERVDAARMKVQNAFSAVLDEIESDQTVQSGQESRELLAQLGMAAPSQPLEEVDIPDTGDFLGLRSMATVVDKLRVSVLKGQASLRAQTESIPIEQAMQEIVAELADMELPESKTNR